MSSVKLTMKIVLKEQVSSFVTNKTIKHELKTLILIYWLLKILNSFKENY